MFCKQKNCKEHREHCRIRKTPCKEHREHCRRGKTPYNVHREHCRRRKTPCNVHREHFRRRKTPFNVHREHCRRRKTPCNVHVAKMKIFLHSLKTCASANLLSSRVYCICPGSEMGRQITLCVQRVLLKVLQLHLSYSLLKHVGRLTHCGQSVTQVSYSVRD
jgi:hypothetical protein